MDIETLADNFELLGPWEERYRYLIDLGRQLEPMPESEKTEANRVRGCMSQVWLTHEVSDDTPPKLHFRGDSDAHIVKGLIALLFMAYSDKTAEQIRQTDIKALFGRLGLESHLSMNRRNGFYAMVERIRALAGQPAEA
ncbi:SufE family protein [uncultured Abyssibacter sp.]|uniref:SufE family protein n=1 Tax=uncultured Abyssibacter sp. TaxID=2320202 RepID=UPI0032B0FBB0